MALLEVHNLKTYFETHDGVVKAVDDVSFKVEAGQTLGIVGESGSGKSVLNLSLLQLIPNPPGRVVGGTATFDGQNLFALSRSEMRNIRGNKIAMIFQDPMTSLNPFLTIERQLTEVLEIHQGLDRRQARKHAVEMLDLVGIPDPAKRICCYPHQFSGGMRQRVMIAMALLCKPQLLIADEPTTALDVTIQAQILELLKKLQDEFGMAMILITHNLGVVAGVTDRVAVMYAGRIVEEAATEQLFSKPIHPYTRALLKSVPRLDEKKSERLVSIKDQPPDLANLPDGCHFYPRCDLVQQRCREEDQSLKACGQNQRAACWVTTQNL